MTGEPSREAKRITVIGIGDDGAAGLPAAYIERIRGSEVLIGGERQLTFFEEHPAEKIVLKSGLGELVEKLRAEERPAVVLASGDPLFYGIGGYLAGKLPGRVEVLPQVSSVQLAFARMGESWQDALITSVHGRSMKGLAQRIDGCAKVALLTDEKNTPGAIARYLLNFGMTEYRVFVGENLGGPQERTGWHELETLAETPDDAFSPLNVVVLRRRADAEAPPVWPLGIDDGEFAQRKPDKGLITKKEVRILSIANLGLKRDSVVWDIGTCTGSVAIEAARIARDGAVYAVEKNEGDLENFRQNARKFRTDITAVHAKAPEGLDGFPDPDAVFIGGSGGELRELLALCCARLKPGGRIVLNAATIENLAAASKAFGEEGFETDITLAQLSRSKPILDMTRFEALNPIWIITAKRGKGDAGPDGEPAASTGRKERKKNDE
ncbi:bifunctional cobalt-precorrin-7 (C(5))-methyltransferase/cobalt-precorrin-6B (C(15))-methyltransferase [Paenibacillus mucilaginosus]|uniref:bifunctional cobalt-precorrin-7 (C(5))-methyltransferase/cobalt-precorrin-6B (C(15))-methyltransferase n=1 Tax=Paenibacillus mucilaginosus TaxID=61624 RepID=UPI0002FD7777|nr:bifunctional cobalt-precorrin-7 (C(5))-methyltransferase/cobalt-precorrin-6B (C(15))-methyltransferase [Paenibacillus mucilaginosus]MCG7212770.1 bifunctional cobalt-precorrin-7 (C(5))-methyltransferase/cobalt-precorrin-6B (C(15))-methyltransferase [Paenibacillus mucilaginosus]WDM26804.1 bifunctional cobalt-precorrin-7 (C(5))-methyltransferase/cobalt-precorrin-6B (C(15))-methyltransferase [Paenibacillus mucilaginosus]